MLKKTIEYTDFNDKKRVEEFLFNLTKQEVTEMELSHKGGLVNRIDTIVKAESNGEIVALFKSLILDSYGIKSEDGRRFMKTQEIRESFEQTEAFSVLFMELASDAEAAAAFVNGIIPEATKDVAAKISK